MARALGEEESDVGVFVELFHGRDAADAKEALTDAGLVIEDQIGNRFIGRISPVEVEKLRAMDMVRIVEISYRMDPRG